MKKWLKTILFPLLALFLVACGNSQKKAPNENETTVETTQAANQTTVAEQEADKDKKDSSKEEAAKEDEEGQEKEEKSSGQASAEGEEGTASLKVYVKDELKAEFTVENIGGVSVLDAMSATDLEFNFNEEQGIIDVIDGVENDYQPNTWMYLYNGQYAELGVISQKLQDGDEIEWYYGTIDDLPVNIIPAE
ncbi:DUF4430 domain-containing protein [Facklamia languida]